MNIKTGTSFTHDDENNQKTLTIQAGSCEVCRHMWSPHSTQENKSTWQRILAATQGMQLVIRPWRGAGTIDSK